MKKFILLSFIFTFTLFSASAKIGSSLFAFKGKVYLDYSKGKNVTIKLYDGNKKVSEYETSSNGKFVFDARRNKHYTMVFEKDGFVTKRIIIDTEVNPKKAVDVEEFKFDVSLLPEIEGVDYSVLDFPIALIEFKNDKSKFDYNRKYTDEMLKAQETIISNTEALAFE